MPMQQNIFASAGTFPSENFAAPYATRRSNLGQTGYARYGAYDNTSGMAATQASTAGLPASLVERVIRRESGGNPHAVHAGNYGLMQIRLGTARAMGYTGSASGLLDPQTNMTYALRYLAGAYRAAGGNENRAIALYTRGYYGQAKAQGFSPYASGAAAPAGGIDGTTGLNHPA
jgi:soluble lytic murein transglycosylase-like protein